MDEIVTIELFGEKFRFRPETETCDSEKIVESVKHYVETATEQFQYNSSERNKFAILLLAVMNISQDFHELKREYGRLEGYVSKRTSSLLKKIEDGIQ